MRARVAFYASTPAYVAAFEHEGYGEVARTLQTHSRAQRWDDMPGLVDDEMLDRYAVIGTHDEIAAKLKSRYGGLATALEFAIPLAEVPGRGDAAGADRQPATGLIPDPHEQALWQNARRTGRGADGAATPLAARRYAAAGRQRADPETRDGDPSRQAGVRDLAPEGLQYPRELLDREPETIDWIDSFEAPCRFWDIGANVGTYALYAALRPGVSVLAFEPAPASYAALCRNIEANGSGDRIEALCIALSDRTRLGSLNMSATNAGNSFNSFESTQDCFGRELDIRFRQAAVGFTVEISAGCSRSRRRIT